ncbi:MAG TPA: molybdopterin-binding protein [Thermodesulfovibrionales bacterium]|nr:molybdopterin-binding protein [Thermodesulfovibrionales bacterium]
MCDTHSGEGKMKAGIMTIPLHEAVGKVLAHDITEIRKDEFKGRAFKRGQIVREEDICYLQRLGKEHLFILTLSDDEMHEDDAARLLASALMGRGVEIQGEPKEGKINIVAAKDGLLKVNKDLLLEFNMLGDAMCATMHNNTVVTKGRIVAGTRAIPLVLKKRIVEEAVSVARKGQGIIEVKEMRRPRAGVVITGNEVYHGRIKDAFAPVVEKKIRDFDGEVVGIYYAPDDEGFIEARLRELLSAGADLLITTGGMSVDPDDVTRFAVRRLGAVGMTYGSAVLPGAMFLIAYVPVAPSADKTSPLPQQGSSEFSDSCSAGLIPLLGIPACGMYHKTTVFDLILPRVLASEWIGRRELAELGHGGLCLDCGECTFPVCPFGT